MSHQNDQYNDNNYPIEPIWALKSTLVSLIFVPFLMVVIILIVWNFFQSSLDSLTHYGSYAIYPAYYFIFIPFHFFANVIRRATYHYQLEDKFLNLKQGVINKQNRQLPYGVIQNVLVTRGLLDRIFGLSTLTIQNATQSTVTDLKAQAANSAGFFGNTINIPGLSKENAEEIKGVLLKKIKESPIVELGM